MCWGGGYIYESCLSTMITITIHRHKCELNRREVERNAGIYCIGGFVLGGVLYVCVSSQCYDALTLLLLGHSLLSLLAEPRSCCLPIG